MHHERIVPDNPILTSANRKSGNLSAFDQEKRPLRSCATAAASRRLPVPIQGPA
jgi:hypothetical protein